VNILLIFSVVNLKSQAENGKEGVDLALKRIPDIIISDIMMPIMDGIELCKQLKDDVRTTHIFHHYIANSKGFNAG
jgi:YesN/AraC family two-component response regulator